MDHREFLRNFLPNQNRIKAFLMAATGNVQDMEELFQEVSVILWEKFEQYDPARPFPAWMLGVARLQVLKWRQKHARERLVFSEETLAMLASESEVLNKANEEQVQILRGCIAKLSPMHRTVLRMRYEEACPIKIIAERTERTAGCIQMMLQRTREILRKCMDRSQPA